MYIKDIEKRTRRLEINNIKKTNIKYYYFTVSMYNSSFDHRVKQNGVISSDTGYFPLKIVNDRLTNENINDILFINVMEISEEDYNWKYADFSKFGDEYGG